MNTRNIPLFLQAVWSTGLNITIRIIPAYFSSLSSATSIGSIFSLYSASKFFQIPCGWLTDRIGKAKTLLLTFLILPAIVIAFTFSKSVFYFAILFLFIGILGNFYYPAINALITIIFQKKTEALFKLEAMYQIGMGLGPIIGGFWVGTKYGLNYAFYTWAGLSFLGLILSNFLFKELKRAQIDAQKKPSWRELFSQLGAKKTDFLLFLIFGSFLSGIFEVILTFVFPLYANFLKFPLSHIGYIIGLGSALSIFGFIFLGKLLERIKKYSGLILTIFLCGVSSLLFILFPSFWALIPIIAIFTLGRAGTLNVARAFISENLSEEIRATGMSISDFSQYLARTISPLFFGFLIDLFDKNPQPVFFLSLLISLISITILNFYMRKFKRNKLAMSNVAS